MLRWPEPPSSGICEMVGLALTSQCRRAGFVSDDLTLPAAEGVNAHDPSQVIDGLAEPRTISEQDARCPLLGWAEARYRFRGSHGWLQPTQRLASIPRHS
jgi:hypothetical protein